VFQANSFKEIPSRYVYNEARSYATVREQYRYNTLQALNFVSHSCPEVKFNILPVFLIRFNWICLHRNAVYFSSTNIITYKVAKSIGEGETILKKLGDRKKNTEILQEIKLEEFKER